MKKLDLLLKNVESKIALRNNKNTSVSKSDVAWHLDHVLKVINGISSVVKKSNPNDYNPSFNFKRILVLSLGKIPRGKAKAPETVVSIGEVTLKDLNLQLEKAKIAVRDFETCAPKSNFKHPYFGDLNCKQTIRFLEIHTHHHLKIVEDIINKH